MTKKNKNAIIIEKIDAVPLPLPNEETWIKIVKAFNPLGAIAEAYTRTLAYKIECKRLDGELERISLQAFTMQEIVDKTYELKLEELRQRRFALEKFYDTVQSELQRLHIERIAVLEMAKLATKKTLEDDIPMEERKIFKELATEMVAQIPIFGDRANQSLQKLVQVLPPVDIPTTLLTSGE